MFLGLAHRKLLVGLTTECLRRHVSGDYDDIDLLMLGARKILKTCCTPGMGRLPTLNPSLLSPQNVSVALKRGKERGIKRFTTEKSIPH